MRISGPGGGGGSDSVLASEFVDGGSIKTMKLMGTALGAVWLTFASGWIALMNAFARLHMAPINAAASLYATVLRTVGDEAVSASTLAWGEAFRAAIEVSPVLAPAILTAELLLVGAMFTEARRRWV